jgi:hypothetical protein
MQLILVGSFCGETIRVLLDSGATTCFVSSAFVKRHNLQLTDMTEINVTLGDDSVQKTSRGVADKLYLGDNVATDFSAHEFNLPHGCDALAGYNWMKQNGVIIDCASDRISLTGSDSARHIVAMAYGMQHHGDNLTTQKVTETADCCEPTHTAHTADTEAMSDPDTDSQSRTAGPGATAASEPHEASTERATPAEILAHGVHDVSDKFDVLSVCSATMSKLQRKMKTGTLSYNDVDGQIFASSTEKPKGSASAPPPPQTAAVATHGKVILKSGHGRARTKKDRDDDTGQSSTENYTSTCRSKYTGVCSKNRDRTDFHDKSSSGAWHAKFPTSNSDKFVPPAASENDDEVFMLHVTFHPEGTYDVVAEGDSERGTAKDAADSTASCCSAGATEASVSEVEADPAKWKDVRIRQLSDAEQCMSAQSDESASPKGAEGELIVSDKIFPADSDGIRWGIKTILVPGEGKSASRVRTTLYSMKADEVLASYPIDESEIDKTIKEHRPWVAALVSHKLGKFKCLTKMQRWEYKEGDPLLKLVLKPDAKLRSASYRTPVHLLPELKKWIQKMLDQGLIRRSESTFTAPILVLRKPGVNKDGSAKGFRFVSDFRLLNECIDPPVYHQPDIVSMYERLRTAKCLSTVDMSDGYFNAGLHPDSQNLTAFSSPWGTFSYVCVSQGLISSAAHFQEWVSIKLRRAGILLEHAPIVNEDPTDSAADPVHSHMSTDPPSSGENPKRQCGEHTNAAGTEKLQTGKGFVANYCDDLIICSDSPEEHKRHLLKLFEVLSEENIYLRPEKCVFFSKYVRYLGAICGQDMLLTDPKKIRSIVDMPDPRNNQTQIRGFVGMCSFWRRWIPHFAQTVAPLNALLKKGVDVEEAWTARHSEACAELKRRLIAHPVLQQPDPAKQFHVIGDACDLSIGSCLAQEHDGQLLPVAFCSRALNKHELNYSTQEKECLAIVYAMQKFRHYILCSQVKIKICTDHHSLQFMQRPGQAVGRVARWSMIMSEYNYEIKWIQGKTNHVGDTLSRLIKIPEGDWHNAEVDDDTVHPFLMVWEHYIREQTADVQLFVAGESAQQCHHCATCGQKFESRNKLFAHLRASPTCMCSSETVASMQCENQTISDDPEKSVDPPAPPTVPHSDTVDGTDDKTEAYWAAEEQRLHLKSDRWHEQILFSFHKPKVAASPVNITEEDYCNDPDFKIVYGILLKNKLHLEREERHATQLSDRETKPTVSQLIWTKEERGQFKLAEKCYLRDGLLYRRFQDRDCLCVPEVSDTQDIRLRFRIVKEFHDTPTSGHRGADATYAAVSRRFYWKRMKDEIQKYISGCEICQKNKIRRQANNTKLEPLHIPERIGDAYNVDFMTKLPKSGKDEFDMCMILVDRLSQRVFHINMHESATAEDCATAFYDEIVCNQGRGWPKYIVSDRDVRFTAKFWRELQRRSGTCIRFSTARQQSTNGSAERAIAVVDECISMFCNYKQDNWSQLMPQIVYAINDSPSSALQHQRTPLYVELGHHPRRPIDFLDCLPELEGSGETIDERIDRLRSLRDQVYEAVFAYRTQMKETADGRSRRDTNKSEFAPGKKVWLDIDGLSFSDFSLRPAPKLNPRYFGPFVVSAQPSPNRFELILPKDSKAHPIFHINRLKAYTDPDMLKYKGTRKALPKEWIENKKWSVKEILDDDYKYKTQFYKVLWSAGDETWEPREHLLPGAKKLLDAYEKEHGIVDGKGVSKRLRKRKARR